MTKKSVFKITEYTDKGLNITAFTKDANIKQLDNYFYIYNNFSNLKYKFACAKNRSKIKASQAKPYKQKGTGRARRGSKKSPLLVGGGVVFGPSPRIKQFKLNTKFFLQFKKLFLTYFSSKILVINLDDNVSGVNSFHKSFPEFKSKNISFISDISETNLSSQLSNVKTYNFFNINNIKLPVLFSSDFIVFTPLSLKKFIIEE